jgi:hypothetical protein
MLFAIWLVVAVASVPWAMARAHKQGYSMGPWFLLAFVFGPIAVVATYLLPKKEPHESVAEAAARGVTTGAIVAGRAIHATARAEAPGLAAATGRGISNGAINLGSGVKDAIDQRRGSETDRDATGGLAAAAGRGVANAAFNMGSGVKQAVAERRPRQVNGDAPRPSAARRLGTGVARTARDFKAGLGDGHAPVAEESLPGNGATPDEPLSA